MSSPLPLVTVVVPTMNRANLLRLTLESALNQTYRNIEILVSDNASEDGTWSFLQGIADQRMRTFRRPTRLPMYDHWNAILEEARGNYFLLLSDDDILESNAIESMVSRFETNPSLGLVFCRGVVIDTHGHEVIPGQAAKPVLSAEEMMLGFFRSELDLWPCAILFRRSDVYPGYSAEFPLGADTAVWMRVVAKYGRAGFISDPLTRYRVHQNTTSTVGFHAWRDDNLRLATYAAELLDSSGRASPGIREKLHSESKRLNLRIMAGLIKARSTGSKPKALILLLRNIKPFVSLYGGWVLSKSIIEVLAPRKLRKHLVGLSRILKGQAAFLSRSG